MTDLNHTKFNFMRALKIVIPSVLVYLIFFFACKFYGTYFLAIPIGDVQVKNKIISNTILKKNFKFVVLGDSSSIVSLMPQVLGDSTVNLSGWGTSTMDNYYILKRYLASHSEAPKCILLTNSYFTDLHYQGKLWTMQIPTDFYSFQELNDIYNTSKVNGGYPASEYFYVEYLSMVLWAKLKLNLLPFISLRRIIYGPSAENFRYTYRNLDISITRGFVENNKDTKMNQIKLSGEINFYKHPFKPFITEDFYTKETLDLASKHNIHVIVMPSPFNRDFATGQILQHQKDFYAHLQKLSSQFGNSTFILPPKLDGSKFDSLTHIKGEHAKEYSLLFKQAIEGVCPLQ